MAEQENSNKRAYIGIAIFAVLIIANLLARGTRRPATVIQERPPAQTSQPVSQTETTPKPSGEAPQPITLPTETTGIDQQILNLNQLAEQFSNRVAGVPEPLSVPDNRVTLPQSIVNRLTWLTAASGTVQLPVEPGPDVPQPRLVSIIGDFAVGNKRKYLIRENNRVFIVGDDQLPEDGQISVMPGQDGQFVVKDTEGLTHTLNTTQPENKGVDEAMKVLRGGGSRQMSFDVSPSSPAASQVASQTAEP